MLKSKRTKACPVAATREDLNVLMEAMALILARRQMKRHWATAHRTLPSII